MKLFLDTNVLLDYFTRRSPFFDTSKLLWIAKSFDDVELCASAQSFTDIEYILRKAVPVLELREMMNSSLKLLQIAPIQPDDLAAGLASNWPDLEDYLIAACSENMGADYIITRDLEGFKESKVPSLTPEQFFEMLKIKYGITYDEVLL